MSSIVVDARLSLFVADVYHNIKHTFGGTGSSNVWVVGVELFYESTFLIKTGEASSLSSGSPLIDSIQVIKSNKFPDYINGKLIYLGAYVQGVDFDKRLLCL
jgi:hypothetical protein